MTAPVQRTAHLTPDEVVEVLDLARAAGDADGAYPLSEHIVLHVRHGGDEPAIHLLVRQDGQLVGYAHVDTTDVIEGASAELVVHPMFRRRRLGRALAAVGARRPPVGHRAGAVARPAPDPGAVADAPLAVRPAARPGATGGRHGPGVPAGGGRRALGGAQRAGLRRPARPGPVDAEDRK